MTHYWVSIILVVLHCSVTVRCYFQIPLGRLSVALLEVFTVLLHFYQLKTKIGMQ